MTAITFGIWWTIVREAAGTALRLFRPTDFR
jgi:hypothetical protein